jgi:5-methylcytosine-specific restriction protein B
VIHAVQTVTDNEIRDGDNLAQGWAWTTTDDVIVKIEMMPEPAMLGTVARVDMCALLERLNARIAALLDRDHQIGHSSFMGITGIEQLRFAWYYRIVPLLQEYFYNDGDRLAAVLGDAFVQHSTANVSQLFGTHADAVDPDRTDVVICRFDGDDEGFLAALAHLASTPTQTTP